VTECLKWTATRRLEKHGDVRRDTMPIVAATANAMRGAAGKCIAAGMDDYRVKPATLDGFSDALKKWTRDGKSARPLWTGSSDPVTWKPVERELCPS
jgi:CheY-like chemotaxis protein